MHVTACVLQKEVAVRKTKNREAMLRAGILREEESADSESQIKPGGESAVAGGPLREVRVPFSPCFLSPNDSSSALQGFSFPAPPLCNPLSPHACLHRDLSLPVSRKPRPL